MTVIYFSVLFSTFSFTFVLFLSGLLPLITQHERIVKWLLYHSFRFRIFNIQILDGGHIIITKIVSICYTVYVAKIKKLLLPKILLFFLATIPYTPLSIMIMISFLAILNLHYALLQLLLTRNLFSSPTIPTFLLERNFQTGGLNREWALSVFCEIVQFCCTILMDDAIVL